MKTHLNDQNFDIDNYDEFYEEHYFQPLTDEQAINAHELYPRVGWATDIAKELKSERVLDLGCLEGFTVLTIANHVDSVKLGVGVDLSKDGTEMGRRRSENVGLPVDFYQQPIEEYLATTKDKFDLICAFEVMEHVKDPELVFRLIDAVLAPGGTVLISTPDFEGPDFGKNDVTNTCHIRLYTTKDEDYEEMTDRPSPKTGLPYMRTATSLPKQIGKERILEMQVINGLINARYK